VKETLSSDLQRIRVGQFMKKFHHVNIATVNDVWEAGVV